MDYKLFWAAQNYLEKHFKGGRSRRRQKKMAEWTGLEFVDSQT